MPTFNPDANPETSSVDGVANRDPAGGESWATIHDSAGQFADDSSAVLDGCALEAFTTTDQWTRLQRGFFLFDTASLADDANIDSAFLELYVTTKIDQLGGQSTLVVGSTPASNTAIAASDYQNIGTTAYSSTKTIASLTTSAYNSWQLNATGITNISKTGVTKLGMRLESDRANSPPTWVSGEIASFSCQFAEGANKPRLVVNLKGGGAFLLNLMSFVLGLFASKATLVNLGLLKQHVFYAKEAA